MKKVLTILAIALFLGGITVPAVAAIHSAQTVIVLGEDDPATDTKATDVKAEKKTEAVTKSGECAAPAKSETAKSETTKSETAKSAGECSNTTVAQTVKK